MIPKNKSNPYYNRLKKMKLPVCTEDDYFIKQKKYYAEMILSAGIKIHATVPAQVQEWIDNDMAEIKEIENPSVYTREMEPTLKMAYPKNEYVKYFKSLI